MNDGRAKSLFDRTFDVLVIGGGNAGCAAAIAAARMGADTVLVERYGFLGGTATAAMVAPWMTYHAGTVEKNERVTGGIPQEIVERLVKAGASPGHVRDASDYVATVTPFDPEYHKWLLFEMCEESGVSLLLHSLFVEPLMRGIEITGAVFQTVGGRREVRAARVIDATADAHVATAAGVPFEMGNRTDGLVQPMTMIFKLSHVDLNRTADYFREHPEEIRTSLAPGEWNSDTLTAVAGLWQIWRAAREAGEVDIPREVVSFFRTPYRDEVTVNMTRVTELNPLDPEDLTRAEIETRRQVMQLVKFFQRRVPGFENARLAATPTQVGVRETRRIIGEYSLTADDLLQARTFADAVARSGYPIDIHNPKGEGTKTMRLPEGATYEIPYRCLVPQKIDNLLVAGRCISVTHEALASTRLTPTIMTLGQAAGCAAAMSVAAHVSPRDVDVKTLRAILVEQGVDLRRRKAKVVSE